MVKRLLSERYRASSSSSGAGAGAGLLLDSEFKKVAKRLTEKLHDLMWEYGGKTGGVSRLAANPSRGQGGDGLFQDSRDAPWAETFIVKYMEERAEQKARGRA